MAGPDSEKSNQEEDVEYVSEEVILQIEQDQQQNMEDVDSDYEE